MACRCEEEFNPWPSFVDIFSSVILVLLLFLLVVLTNLGYYAQFKYKVSYSGSISSDDIIRNNNKTNEENTPNTNAIADPTSGSNSNSDINIQIIEEQKQKILTLQKQIGEKDSSEASSDATKKLESAGVDVGQKEDSGKDEQTIIETGEYMVITFKGAEVFIDDGTTKKVKQFLEKIKQSAPKHKVIIYSKDMKEQLSATISRQISLARTLGTKNLVRKLGYEKKDVKVDLTSDIQIKEKIEDKNGYLIIKIEK